LTEPATRDWRRDAIWSAVVLVAYVVLGRLSLAAFALLHPTASPVWPSAGIAIAAVLLGGLRYAPAVAVGAFLVNVTNPGGQTGILGSLAIAAGNTAEAVVVVLLVRRLAGGQDAFAAPRGIFLFALCVASASLLAAVTGVLTLLSTGLAASDAARVLATWWLGDAVGALLVVPVIVLWTRDRLPGPLRTRRDEAVILGACVLLLGAVTAGASALGTPHQGAQLRFLSLPLILWAALRFGAREAATVTLAAAALLIANFVAFGPDPGDAALTLLILQGSFGVSSVTGLAVAAVVQQRRQALEALRAARDELELRVAVRTAALETALDDLARSNKDLQEFAYVASHDLQEPLRTVAGYTQLLERRHAAELSPEARGLITKAVDGASRMQSLINDLLAFSRVGTHGQPLRPVAFEEPLKVALRNLDPAIQEAKAVVTHDARLPSVLADDVQMVQLVQNLVGNALKFHRPGQAPRVHVGAEPHPNGLATFYVRDDGIGIEPRHHDRIFVIFQRLHRPGEYPGSGIGLAVAKRIVERHGGRIWVDSQPGQGATFRFTLRTV
jgi:signal transduction histidine kinase